MKLNRASDCIGIEEWYGNWYKCKNCDSNNIRECVNYCDECGIKIEWEKECR